jgi:biopolymer transport protein ExbD
MVDVVFLLLVFFMLAAQIGREAALPLAAAGGGATYSGPPRLVEIGPERITLNGRPLTLGALPDALAPLMPAPDAVIVLRPRDGARLQRLIEVAEALDAAGFAALAVVE